MQEKRTIDPKEEVAQFVIAVFDDWDALQAALQSIAPSNLVGTVLHGRKDNGPATTGLGQPDDVVELHFAHSKRRVCCTRGWSQKSSQDWQSVRAASPTPYTDG
jgi:hypothetical protein